MSWIDAVDTETLKYWLENTNAPMLCTHADGGIFWCNAAFEELTRYSLQEFTRPINPVKWTDLTVGSSDLDSDNHLAQELYNGDRKHYRFSKKYQRKNNGIVPVVIDVLRYPIVGDFQFALITARALDPKAEVFDAGLKNIFTQLRAIQKTISVSDTEKILKWSDKNPKKSGAVLVFFAFLLFGNRVLEVMESLKIFFTGG